MHSPLADFAQRCFQLTTETLPEWENRLREHRLSRHHISRDTNKDFQDSMTFGQRVADKVASFGGSWTFILIFVGILLTWIVTNSLILVGHGRHPFDPYPYILLNLVLSMVAALQAPVIMMSQNRQAAKDRLDATHDYEVNLKAELEIMSLHEKLDVLREQQWMELIRMQQEQITLLTRLLEERSSETS
jgi:uncharacterized membrane protein